MFAIRYLRELNIRHFLIIELLDEILIVYIGSIIRQKTQIFSEVI